jgi:8-oxo-dGTP pyrophosphatase MutT (NUDIX family)
MISQNLSQNYPHLFQEVTWPWGPTKAKFILIEKTIPAHLISKINIVPRMAGQWVMIRLKDGSWDIPGGTLEPGEDYMTAIRRELMEEVGAKLASFQIFGGWHCLSLADKPYRPHLSHPESYRLVGVGEIEIVSSPQIPADGEEVVLVESVSLDLASRRFRDMGREDLMELYQLANQIVSGT